MSYLEEFIELAKNNGLRGVKKTHKGYVALCPCHNDHNPSLHLDCVTSNGKEEIKVYCQACEANGGALCENLGIEKFRLYPPEQRIGRTKKESNLISYDYFNLNGQYCFSKARKRDRKDFFCGIRKSGGYIDVKDKEKIRDAIKQNTYFGSSINEIQKAKENNKVICYAEGEKDTETVIKQGFCCVTCGGANNWNANIKSIFEGARVVIFRDNDAEGLKLAEKVKSDVKDVAKDVVIINPCPEDPKADISDYMLTHTKKDFENLVDLYAHDKADFHNKNDKGKVISVFDDAIFSHIKRTQNIFIVGSSIYVYKNGVYILDQNGCHIKTLIRNLIYPKFIKSTTIDRIFKLFLQDATLQKNPKDLNNFPNKKHCIAFKDCLYDTQTGEKHKYKPEYLCVNQLPHELPSGVPKGDKIDSFLDFALDSEEDREMLLEFIGYGMTIDTSMQKFMVINGIGGTGKSLLIRLIESIIGTENISNVSLSELSNRFMPIRLMGKLLNSCADLQISALEDTAMLKRLLGEDTLTGERKGENSISFKSYAKLIFSTNELPVVKSEKTNGFYRRLLILNMNNKPKKVNPNLYEELESQIDYLIYQSLQAVQRMYKRGYILESKSSIASVQRLRADSDSIAAFLEEFGYVPDDTKEERIDRIVMYNDYKKYCEENERTPHIKNQFNKAMRVKGFKEIKSHGYYYFFCKQIGRENGEDFSPNLAPDCPFIE